MNVFILRMKIMFNRKVFWIIYILIAMSIGFLVNSLYEQVEAGMQFPLALVDYDNSEFSKLVMEGISDNELLIVSMVTESKGDELVRNRKVEALVIINQGAEKKVRDGDLDNLFTVNYLEGNSFIAMLTDILSGDFLDEISLITSGRYYLDGYSKLLDANVEKNIYNNVYETGKALDFSDKKDYYLKVELVGDESKDLSWYNQNILLEKMTIGVVYIFIAFFILFEGLDILVDRRSSGYTKLNLLHMSRWVINLAEWFSLVVSGLMMLLPFLWVTVMNKGNGLYISYISVLYIIGTSSLVYVLVHLMTKDELYLLMGTSFILATGIVSGSFFAVDYTTFTSKILARAFPVFYSVNAYFDKGYIIEYSIYTILYFIILFGLCLIIDKRTLRSRT